MIPDRAKGAVPQLILLRLRNIGWPAKLRLLAPNDTVHIENISIIPPDFIKCRITTVYRRKTLPRRSDLTRFLIGGNDGNNGIDSNQQYHSANRIGRVDKTKKSGGPSVNMRNKKRNGKRYGKNYIPVLPII